MPAYAPFPPAFPWPKWQQVLEDLAAKGLSAAQIAREISRISGRKVSRGAVIGRMDRTGIKLRNPSPRSGYAPFVGAA